jgi:hypothetical protein
MNRRETMCAVPRRSELRRGHADRSQAVRSGLEKDLDRVLPAMLDSVRPIAALSLISGSSS